MVKIDAEKCIECGVCAADCIALNIEIKDKKVNIKQVVQKRNNQELNIPTVSSL